MMLTSSTMAAPVTTNKRNPINGKAIGNPAGISNAIAAAQPKLQGTIGNPGIFDRLAAGDTIKRKPIGNTGFSNAIAAADPFTRKAIGNP